LILFALAQERLDRSRRFDGARCRAPSGRSRGRFAVAKPGGFSRQILGVYTKIGGIGRRKVKKM